MPGVSSAGDRGNGWDGLNGEGEAVDRPRTFPDQLRPAILRGTAPLATAGPFAYLDLVTAILPIFAGPRRQLLRFDAAGTFSPLTVAAPDLIRWVEAKDPQAIGSWRDLGADEYARAFTAAQTAGLDIVDDLYFAFADTIAAKGDAKDFARLVVPTLQAKGWLARPDDLAGEGARRIATRVDLIFDTNLRVARAAGLWDRVQRSKDGMPYLRAATAQDPRVRRPPKSPDSDHRAWQGILLPVDHPFWTRWWPPLGFRCRCTVTPYTRSGIARHGWSVTPADDLAEREARLGASIFLPPGAGAYQQLAKTAEVENSAIPRMPGLPTLDVAAARREGGDMWRHQAAEAAVDALLDSLFR